MSKRLELNINFLLFATTVVALGVIRHIYRLTLLVQATLSAAPFLAVTTLIWLEVFLLFSFLVGSCLALRTRIGILCSMVGLGGVLLGYVGWFSFTHKELKIFCQNPFYLEHPELVPQHSFGLLGGGWWDILLVISCVILLVWEIKLLVNSHSTKGTAHSETR
jgi:hypothetical protein